MANAINFEDFVSFSTPGNIKPFLANSSYVTSYKSTKPAFFATACDAPAVKTVAVTFMFRALHNGIL